MEKIVVLTGAGISAESGIKTFRDADGLWEGHDIMEIASPQGWTKNPTKVLNFYNIRRRQLLEVKPNAAHMAIVELERKYDVNIITQNIDDLHERAGSKNVLHLHGELLKVRSCEDEEIILDWKKDVNPGDLCPRKSQLRPHVVWFGEAVPMFPVAAEITQQADILIIIGTSMQVYPAASLMDFKKENASVYFIDPKPAIPPHPSVKIIQKNAVKGVVELVNDLLQ
ncbi:MAG TPA: NAD-dependent deacylase [Gillisia sp.]|nr:NAD-dependent deacylase [Gillisia sp.]